MPIHVQHGGEFRRSNAELLPTSQPELLVSALREASRVNDHGTAVDEF
jgi:hypothetical protein